MLVGFLALETWEDLGLGSLVGISCFIAHRLGHDDSRVRLKSTIRLLIPIA